MLRLSLLTLVLSYGQLHADDWPQWMGPNRDGTWNEDGVRKDLSAGPPKVLWRTPIRGGYAGPAVVGDRVFVMDYVTSGDQSPDPGKRSELQGTERVLCLDAATGTEIWKHEYPCAYKISYPSGPRCTPTVVDGKVYALGAEGNLWCLTAEKGDVVWSHELKKEYKTEAPYWGFSSHPLVEGKLLYCVVGGEGSAAVAFDKDTGKELWKSLTAQNVGYSPPTLVSGGGRKHLVIFTTESLNGLDPATGKPLWSVPIDVQFQMPIMSPRQSGDLLYAGGVGNKSVLLKLSENSAEEVWRGKTTTGIYSVCSTPLIDGETMYGVCTNGELRAVDFKTGKRLWETYVPTTGNRRANSGTAFLVRNPKVDRYFLMSETGTLFIAKLSPTGYEETGKAKLLEPTTDAFGRLVVWSHPAFANRQMFARNDKEIIAVSLQEP